MTVPGYSLSLSLCQTRAYYVAQAGLKFIVLSQPPTPPSRITLICQAKEDVLDVFLIVFIFFVSSR